MQTQLDVRMLSVAKGNAMIAAKLDKLSQKMTESMELTEARLNQSRRNETDLSPALANPV